MGLEHKVSQSQQLRSLQSKMNLNPEHELLEGEHGSRTHPSEQILSVPLGDGFRTEYFTLKVVGVCKVVGRHLVLALFWSSSSVLSFLANEGLLKGKILLTAVG